MADRSPARPDGSLSGAQTPPFSVDLINLDELRQRPQYQYPDDRIERATLTAAELDALLDAVEAAQRWYAAEHDPDAPDTWHEACDAVEAALARFGVAAGTEETQ